MLRNVVHIANLLVVSVLMMALLLTPASAWGLKTHVWIAQQVLNDVTDDGQIEIVGGRYPIDPSTVDALRLFPNQFRMGNLGPDVFPDPVVGQTTTHPGVNGGWQTDQWLSHLVRNARSQEELAMAWGFVGHAAGDVFAHTYVNAFAGDIFLLTDGEREVERRHFVLEKYIESLTPTPQSAQGSSLAWGQGLEMSVSGVRDLLIFRSDVAAQNAKAGTGVHLAAMYEVRRAVLNAGRETQNVLEKITTWAADYYKLKLKLQLDLATGKLQLEAADRSLKLQRELLELKAKAYEAALSALQKGIEIDREHPEIISFQNKLLAEQAKLVVDLTAEALRIANDVNNFVADVETRIASLRGEVIGLACYLLVWPKAVKKCRGAVDRINSQISDLEGKISGARARQAAANEAVRIADENRAGTKRLIDNLYDELNKARTGLATGAYNAAVAAAEIELNLQRKQLEIAQRAVDEARKLRDRIAGELDVVERIIDEIKKVVDRYNVITLFVKNWVEGIDKAGGKYVIASSSAGRDMLLNQGDPIGHYTQWYQCYGGVFIGVPVQLGDLSCEAKRLLDELNEKFDDAISGLPEILQWLIFPGQTAKRKAMKELEPALDKAKFELTSFLSDKTTADFLSLLSDPESATRDKLREVYAKDDSSKGLLILPDIGEIVDTDLHLQNGILDPSRFPPLKHAVTLAKLSLLPPNSLNKLVSDLAPGYAPGLNLYAEDGQRFSMLFSAVRSIDGNHQWQAYGLPYPRRLGIKHGHPHHSHYGYDWYKDRTTGMRFWTDRYLREKVFLRLFPEPVSGTLGKKAELTRPHYHFPECSANPFPSTQSHDGEIQNADPSCDQPGADIPVSRFSTDTAQQYREEFFTCEKPKLGNPYWVVVGSHRSENAARQQTADINVTYPDVYAETWRPWTTKGGYWTVMIAACTDAERAAAAVQLAKRRGIAPDAFHWYKRAPWQPAGQP